MHLETCIVLLLSCAAALAQRPPWSGGETVESGRVNVVLETSCWTSDACRDEFKKRFTGRVSTVQLRVPRHLTYPVFNHNLIRTAVQHLKSGDAKVVVEPLYMFKNHVEMEELYKVAMELAKESLPQGAFLLDSTGAEENMAVIARELSIIHTVFRHATGRPGKFYSIPPRSFLSTKHLRKYLSFVRKHVTGIRVQLNDENDSFEAEPALSAETLQDMLTVITNSSLVPEVEVRDTAEHKAILQTLARRNRPLTVYQSISRRDFQSRQSQASDSEAKRQRRSPVDLLGFDSDEGVGQRQIGLGKIFPSLGLKPPALSWADRRVAAKRNLEKLFDKFSVGKVRPQKTDSSRVAKLPKQAKSGALDGVAGRAEEANPKFPKDDVAVSMIDRRGDVNGKDYDYVEFGRGAKSGGRRDVLEELSPEEEEKVEKKTEKKAKAKQTSKKAKAQRTAAKTKTKARDLELDELESHPQPSAKRRSNPSSQLLQHHHQDDDGVMNYYVTPDQHGTFQVDVGKEPQYFGEDADGYEMPYQVLNLTAGSYFQPEVEEAVQEVRKQRSGSAKRKARGKRDVSAQSLFEEIRDFYPTMLHRLTSTIDEAVRPKRDNRDPFGLGHIENLLSGNRLGHRSARSSGFIRDDPRTNEIGYKPRPVTLAPIFKPTTEEPTLTNVLEVFLDQWQALRRYWMNFFA